jgi:hypothetical protein
VQINELYIFGKQKFVQKIVNISATEQSILKVSKKKRER